MLTWRCKLKPTRAQYARLDAILESQRLLYNAALQERAEAWRKVNVSISPYLRQRLLLVDPAEDEVYRDMPVSLSRWSLARVEDAMTGFFGRVKRGGKAGFPRFKPMSRWRSFGFMEWSGIRLEKAVKVAGPGSTCSNTVIRIADISFTLELRAIHPTRTYRNDTDSICKASGQKTEGQQWCT